MSEKGKDTLKTMYLECENLMQEIRGIVKTLHNLFADGDCVCRYEDDRIALFWMTSILLEKYDKLSGRIIFGEDPQGGYESELEEVAS